ncbi:MAG TPA: hypothetical protein VGF41_10850, partial [Myxococcaceae bacterium]
MHKALFAALMLLALDAGSAATTPDAAGMNGRTLTVFAAASLRDAFGSLGATFEHQHPGAKVQFNF